MEEPSREVSGLARPVHVPRQQGMQHRALIAVSRRHRKGRQLLVVEHLHLHFLQDCDDSRVLDFVAERPLPGVLGVQTMEFIT